MLSCVDAPGWTNGAGNRTCSDYQSSFCAAGALRTEFGWLGGRTFNYPELSCCACGKARIASPPPPPAAAMTVHGYVLQINSVCRGADREVNKPTFAACEAHCASRKCACSHFVDGVCHFGFTFLGLLKSKEGAQASVRPNAENEPAALKAAAREAADAAAS